MPGAVQRTLFSQFRVQAGFPAARHRLVDGGGARSYRRVEIKVPIEFHNLPDNLEVDSASFTEAQIRVRGPERVIHRLQTADVRATIDLASVHPGERTFDLTGRQVHVPQDLEVVQIIPGQFHLSFDNRETRTVEIRPRVTGTFASGMRVAQVIADPPTIMITGPQRRVDAVEAAVTDPVDVSRSSDASFLRDAGLCSRSSDPSCAPHPDSRDGYYGALGRRDKIRRSMLVGES